MPTNKARLNVTLTPELRGALDRFSAETGISRSQILAQLLSEAVPVIDTMTEAFRLARKSPASAVSAMREAVMGAHVELAQMSLDMAPDKKKVKLRMSTKRD